MRTVYAVMSGQYSDIVTHCLFETLELAHEYIRAIIEANRRYEVELIGFSDGYGASVSDFRIRLLQLWDELPVVKNVDANEQRQADPD